MSSRFSNVTLAPTDPILGVTEAFKNDDDNRKLNLGVGAYRTESLKPYVLRVVQEAEEELLSKKENKEYLPIEGLHEFNEATMRLLLGDNNSAVREKRVAVVQGLSGTGSLRLGAAFLKRFFPGANVYISSPTWGNHKNIFSDAGVKWFEYSYFDSKTVGLDYFGMLSDLKSFPNGSVILLHGCAHNPTGIDPTRDQWRGIADVIEEKGHLPFFDVAYQGFATGDLDQDAGSVRYFVERGLEIFVAQSYSKNLGLYSERIGAFSVVTRSPGDALRVQSQVKRIARAMYSSPPAHGARIVANIVGTPSRFSAWKGELREMAERIQRVRHELYNHIKSKDSGSKDWSFILNQIGMFSYTGLSPPQVENMTRKWHVYMTKDGRISLAGLSSARAEYLSEALLDSYYNVVTKSQL